MIKFLSWLMPSKWETVYYQTISWELIYIGSKEKHFCSLLFQINQHKKTRVLKGQTHDNNIQWEDHLFWQEYAVPWLNGVDTINENGKIIK